jgi:hypothetical protein
MGYTRDASLPILTVIVRVDGGRGVGVVAAGVDAETAQRLLGHANVTLTLQV